MEIVGSRAQHLWDGLCRAYQALGFDQAAGGDEVFRDLVLARIIEPTSKADSLRVLAETGVEPVNYRTVTRRLPVIAKPAVRQSLSASCAQHARLGPASLVLYDVSTLYFETDVGDEFRERGFSKERGNVRRTHRTVTLSDTNVHSPIPHGHVIRRVIRAILGFFRDDALVVEKDLHVVGPGKPQRIAAGAQWWIEVLRVIPAVRG